MGYGFYDTPSHTIYINPLVLKSAEDQHEAVLHLAHELGHALCPDKIYLDSKGYDDLSSYPTAEAYAQAHQKSEGEAIYYEVLAMREVYYNKAKYQEYTKTF